MKIPTTSLDQLRVAREAGHELSFETGEARADYAHRGDRRYRLTCTCGWHSSWKGSQRALKTKLGLHIASAITDVMIESS